MAAAFSSRAVCQRSMLVGQSLCSLQQLKKQSAWIQRPPYFVKRPFVFKCKSGSPTQKHTASHQDITQPVKALLAERVAAPLKALCKAASATAVAGAASLSLILGPADAGSLTASYQGSQLNEVRAIQEALVEAWGIIRATFVDPTYNHADWDGLLDGTLASLTQAQDADSAYSSIKSMLGVLGDPFTRLVTPKEYVQFRINNEGALEGIGLLIASDPDTGHMVVLHPIAGGPAERAGIQAGDELVMVNGSNLQGLDGEAAATLLRGKVGTSVRLKLRTASSSPEPLLREIKLQREVIEISPVFATLLPTTTKGQQPIGYIRLSSFSQVSPQLQHLITCLGSGPASIGSQPFSTVLIPCLQNASTDMERAIEDLERQGAGAYILDLRNNPGGLVKEGLEVAEMWLDSSQKEATLVNTTDREGELQPIVAIGGQPLTTDPLIILVNSGTASASEILAGALRDNHRATLLGETTYGKGRIQSVFELKDGSALFVTVAKYLSPDHHEIDKVGLAPDVRCTLSDVPQIPEPYYGTRGDKSIGAKLETDKCVKMAESALETSNV